MSDSATQRNTRFWKGLLRAGTNALPSDGLGMVFPVFVNQDNGRVRSLGRTLRQRIEDGLVVLDPDAWIPPDDEAPGGCVAVWPIRRDGALGVWQTVPETFLALDADGMIRCVERPEGWALSYVPSGVRNKIESGEVKVNGREGGDGPVVLERTQDLTRAKTVWKRARHDAGWHGSVLLRKLLGERPFDFPKSLYAVRDTLLPLLASKPDAVVLDFFAGSGTTAHAVALLNQADGGTRSSISVTNNEVGEVDARTLSKAGRRPGDEEWEKRGVFDLVTRPRISAAVTGRTPDGQPIDLDYDSEIPMSAGLGDSVEFLELKYLDIEEVELDLAFESVAPLLWLRAGGTGPMIEERSDSDGDPKTFDLTDRYGILFDPDCWRKFVANLPDSVTTAFVVTDSPSVFASVASELPSGMDVVRLYENYLSTFAINHGRSL